MVSRSASDEAWVLGLCDEILGETGIRQATFDWLLGDLSPKTGRRARLRVDGYWPTAGVIVEYREWQHFEATPHFDKPHRLTVSGVHRGDQRARYDRLREQLIPDHELRLVIVRSDALDCTGRGRLHRNRDHDLAVLTDLLTVSLQASRYPISADAAAMRRCTKG